MYSYELRYFNFADTLDIITTVITWLYLNKEKENFQSIKEHREKKYACSFSFTQAFLLALVPEYDGVSWKHKPCPATREKSKDFFC